MRIKLLTTLASLIITSGSLSAATIWFHGGTDNSTGFGVTPDSSQSITWMDCWATELTDDTSYHGNSPLQANRPNQFGLNEAVMVFGFAGTGLDSGDVVSATLHLRQEFSSSSQTWNIEGISNSDAGWDNASMTWNTDGVDGWSGASNTLGSSTINSYGTFSSDTGNDINITIDITSAFRDYLDGTIAGIAFINLANGGSINATDNRFAAYSNDDTTASNHPGLEVTTVPEPSIALLAAISALALIRRRRV